MRITRALSTAFIAPVLATGALAVGGVTVGASDAAAESCTTGLRYRVVAEAGVYREYDSSSNHLSSLIKYKYAGDIVGGVNPAYTGSVTPVKLGTGGVGYMRTSKLDFLGGCA